MNRIIKVVLVSIIFVHTILYFFIGDLMLEQSVYQEFDEFCVRRHQSPNNFEGISEHFFFASCGDEFFRDWYRLKEFVEKSDLSYCDPEKDTLCQGTYRNVETLDYNFAMTDLVSKTVNDSTNKVNLVAFRVCRTNKIPFVWTKLEIDETFTVHSDFHAMIFNDNMNVNENHYIWVLFRWFRVAKIDVKFKE